MEKEDIFYHISSMIIIMVRDCQRYDLHILFDTISKYRWITDNSSFGVIKSEIYKSSLQDYDKSEIFCSMALYSEAV